MVQLAVQLLEVKLSIIYCFVLIKGNYVYRFFVSFSISLISQKIHKLSSTFKTMPKMHSQRGPIFQALIGFA